MINLLPVLQCSYLIRVEMSVAPIDVEVIAVAVHFSKSVGFKHEPDQFGFRLL